MSDLKESTPGTPPTTGKNPEAENALADMASGSKVEFLYTCHPIMRFKFGDFQFNNGLLKIESVEEHEEFLKGLNHPKLPPSERIKIRAVDVKVAEAMVRERLKAPGGATKSIDSSTGDRKTGDQIGQGKLEDSNPPGAADSPENPENEPSGQANPANPLNKLLGQTNPPR